MLDALLTLIAGFLPWTYVLLDGHFGHHHALQMARPSHLPLMSKRRCEAALYLPDAGPDAGRGPHRTCGSQRDNHTMPATYLQETTVAGHIQTRLYQAPRRHQEFAQPLNVVIIVKTTRHPQSRAQVLLFRRDLELAYAPRVDDESLRFHIEFNVRDAKQSWGGEDFMHTTPMGVTHAANLSWFLVKVSYRLQADVRPRDPDDSILDVQADCRGYTDVEETITILPDKPEPVLFGQILHKVACLGRIHVSQPAFSFS